MSQKRNQSRKMDLSTMPKHPLKPLIEKRLGDINKKWLKNRQASSREELDSRENTDSYSPERDENAKGCISDLPNVILVHKGGITMLPIDALQAQMIIDEAENISSVQWEEFISALRSAQLYTAPKRKKTSSSIGKQKGKLPRGKINKKLSEHPRNEDSQYYKPWITVEEFASKEKPPKGTKKNKE